jgi:D-glycero-alpha-D-manno-heptose-7-phosphate kinase
VAEDLAEFGRLMNSHRKWKVRRSAGISNGQIDEWYTCAMSNGELGGKVTGEGGEGLPTFYAGDKATLRLCESTASKKCDSA